MHVGDLHQLPVLHQQPDHVDGALRHAVGELLHGDRLGDHHVADDLLLRRREAVQLALLLLALAAHGGERALALALGSLQRVGDGQAAALALAARRGLGAGRLRHFEALDRSAERERRAQRRSSASSVVVSVRALRHGILAKAAARLVLGAAARLILGLLARFLLGLAALRLGALARKPRLFLGAAARVDLGLLALLGLAHARFLQRMLARVALRVGQRAQHDAAGARRAACGWPASRLDVGAASARRADARPRPASALPRRRRRRASGRFGRTGDATALLLHHDSLRPPAGEALAHGVGVALQRERLARPTRSVLSLLVVSLIHHILRARLPCLSAWPSPTPS